MSPRVPLILTPTLLAQVRSEIVIPQLRIHHGLRKHPAAQGLRAPLGFHRKYGLGFRVLGFRVLSEFRVQELWILPIVSIVVPFGGLPFRILNIKLVKPQKGTTKEAAGSGCLPGVCPAGTRCRLAWIYLTSLSHSTSEALQTFKPSTLHQTSKAPNRCTTSSTESWHEVQASHVQ